ncbi:MAG: hypothetical protein WA817_15935 [Candidatus Acidiferrum sp.]
MMDDEEVVQANKDFLVTETTLDPKVPVDAVMLWLRSRKATGSLMVDISQGGTQRVVLLEKTKAPQGLREKVRKILGV